MKGLEIGVGRGGAAVSIGRAVSIGPSIGLLGVGRGIGIEAPRIAMTPRAQSLAKDFAPIKIVSPASRVEAPIFRNEVRPIQAPRINPGLRVESVLQQAESIALKASKSLERSNVSSIIRRRLKAPGYRPVIDARSVIEKIAQVKPETTVINRTVSQPAVEAQRINLVQILPVSSDTAQMARTEKALQAAGLTYIGGKVAPITGQNTEVKRVTRTITQTLPKESAARAIMTGKKVKQEKNTKENERVTREKRYHVVEWIVQKRRKLDIRIALSRVWEKVAVSGQDKKRLALKDVGAEIPNQYRAVKSSIVSDTETDGSYIQLKEDLRTSKAEYNSMQDAAIAAEKLADDNTAVTVDRDGKRVSREEVAKVKQPNTTLPMAVSTEIVVETIERTPVTETRVLVDEQVVSVESKTEAKKEETAAVLPDINRIVSLPSFLQQKPAA